jgi:hypothetical protein
MNVYRKLNVVAGNSNDLEHDQGTRIDGSKYLEQIKGYREFLTPSDAVHVMNSFDLQEKSPDMISLYYLSLKRYLKKMNIEVPFSSLMDENEITEEFYKGIIELGKFREKQKTEKENRVD